jgi:hypothetical protein
MDVDNDNDNDNDKTIKPEKLLSAQITLQIKG